MRSNINLINVSSRTRTSEGANVCSQCKTNRSLKIEIDTNLAIMDTN
ncbi:hypothetical protein JMJ77_0002196, partial [Colletotrichum scovillei]